MRFAALETTTTTTNNLKLNPEQLIISENKNRIIGLKRQLEVWSAVNDTWLPVCGTHWMPMQMSHEACQALGYSRANETLILYGNQRVNDSSASEGPNKRERKRKRSSPAGWFDVTPGEMYTSIAPPVASSKTVAGSGQPDAMENQQEPEQQELVGVVEDVEASSINYNRLTIYNSHNKFNGADHLITFDRLSFDNNSMSILARQQHSKELETIHSGEVKFKSLTSMLYHGPQSGCLDRSDEMVSNVYLQCENFQCGRPITSYSSRVRHDKVLGLVGSSTESKSKLRARNNMVLGRKDDDDDDDDFDAEDRLIDDSSSSGDHIISESTLDLDKMLLKSSSLAKEELTAGVQKLEKEIASYDKTEKGALIDTLMNPLGVDSRVVGGIESMPGEFPYLAALHGGPDEVFFCGGVLISINWLLTASHCVGNRTQPDGWMVKVGVTRRIASPAFVKKLKLRKIIKHPDFNQNSIFNNDIALILLEESVEFNQYLRPICLPRANLKLGPDNSKDCVVVGFGKSKFSQEANYLHVAHFVNVPIVRHSTCSMWYAEHYVNLTEGMLCAGYAEGKRDACQVSSAPACITLMKKLKQIDRLTFYFLY